MSAKDSSKHEALRRGNADYQWSDLDAEAYFNHYYGEPHPDDDRVVECAVEAIREATPLDRELDIVDVGTGANLIPLFCALPRARSLTVWEYAQNSIVWLRAELASDAMRPQWLHFWNLTRRAYGRDCRLAENPMPALRARTKIEQGSIFDIPERRWDAATMFFCAESITQREDEFEAACAAFARCVKRGGTLAAAFLAHSAGYTVRENRFPALPLSAEFVISAFTPYADRLYAKSIGLVEQQVRSGYSGLVFLTGTSR